MKSFPSVELARRLDNFWLLLGRCKTPGCEPPHLHLISHSGPDLAIRELESLIIGSKIERYLPVGQVDRVLILLQPLQIDLIAFLLVQLAELLLDLLRILPHLHIFTVLVG